MYGDFHLRGTERRREWRERERERERDGNEGTMHFHMYVLSKL